MIMASNNFFHKNFIMYNVSGPWDHSHLSLPILGISYFLQAKKVKLSNLSISQLLVGL